MCKAIDGKECIFPFFYSADNPEIDVYEFAMEFQGCVNNRSRGLWCPTKLEKAKNAQVYVDGEDEVGVQEWEQCSPGCIRHGY